MISKKEKSKICEVVIDQLCTNELIIRLDNYGIKYIKSPANKNTFLYLLKKGLIEKARELFNCKDKTQKKAQIQEFLYSFLKLINICRVSLSDLVRLSNKKNEERGSFDQFIHLVSIQVKNDSFLYTKYKNTKYKEIVSDKENYTTFLLDKLVRDKIVEILEKDDAIVNYKMISEQKRGLFLYKKLLEETQELYKANKDNLNDEMCDVWEVFKSMMAINNISLNILKIINNNVEFFHISSIYLSEDHEMYSFYKKSGYKISILNA